MAKNNLTQCFYVDKVSFPNGIFVSSIEVFLESKDNEIPLILKMGNVKNEIPDEADYFNNGLITLYPDDINISDDASLSTKFTFNVPIFLSPEKTYFFSLKCNSEKYNFFTAVEGDTIIGSNNRVTSHPFTGDFFLPANGDYSVSENEDLKFIINRCEFDTSGGSLNLLNKFYEVPVGDDVEDTTFNTFFIHEDNDNLLGTSTKFFYKKTSVGNVIDTNYTEFTPDTNVNLQTEAKLVKNSFYLKLDFESTENTTSPVFDLNRLNGTFIANKINNDTTGENGLVGGNALSKYITKVVELLPDIDATDLIAYALLKLPAGTDVKIYYKAAPAGVNIVSNSSYIEMEKSAMGTPSTNNFVEYKFTTPTSHIVDGNNYALPDQSIISRFIFKIVLLSSNSVDIPLVRDFRGIALLD